MTNDTFFDRWRLIKDSELPSDAKATLLAVLFYLQADEKCWPKAATLASDLSVSERTLRHRIKGLVEAGIVTKDGRFYSINFVRLSPETDNPLPLGDKINRQPIATSDSPDLTTHCRANGNPLPKARQPIATYSYTNNERNNERTRDATETPRKTNSPKTKPARFDPLKVELPESIDTPEIRAAWGDWVATRRESRKPLTPTSARLAIDKLTRAGPAAALEALQASAANGWQGVFPDTKGGKTNGRGLQGAVFDPAKPVAWF